MGKIACGLVALAGNAAAEPDTAKKPSVAPQTCVQAPERADIAAAKEAFRFGQNAFSEGDYGRAAGLWAEAYERDCTAHGLLLNLATAYELSGRQQDALEVLERFNAREPESSYAEANRKRMAKLRLALAERASERAREAARAQAAAAPPPPPRPAPVLAQPEPEPSLSIPLVVATTGGALAFAGGLVYGEARLAMSSASERCGGASCTALDDVVSGERARARAEAGGWMLGAGVLTAAAGLVWHQLGTSLAPTGVDAQVSSNGARLTCSGSF